MLSGKHPFAWHSKNATHLYRTVVPWPADHAHQGPKIARRGLAQPPSLIAADFGFFYTSSREHMMATLYIASGLLHTLTYGVGPERRPFTVLVSAVSEDDARSKVAGHFKRPENYWITSVDVIDVLATIK